ncbi:MAG TPA: ATP-binding cassette domain-containing protein [Candidatus Saccharimonadales bacterium]|nr:ATP-binding cassette domain-containing protein [Candidatus Saccharimonadales bacterium]
MTVASLRGFTYRYPNAGVPALDNVDLDISDGVTLVAGASGSGKSSLLRVLNGLVPHFHGGTVSGFAEVCGRDVVTTPTRVLATHVGFVFQDPELQAVYPSVERDIAFGLENIGTSPALMVRTVGDALERAGIAHLRKRAVATLSGGERQRLAIAGVLAMRPRLVVLDEPLSQLDADGAAALVTTLVDLAKQGTAVVVAEHRFERLAIVCDRHIEVDGGRAVGTVESTAVRPAVVRSATAMVPARSRGPVAWRVNQLAAGPARSPVLEGVTLEGRRGEIMALMGPNGGGKTTLLRTLAGLLTPISGIVERAPGRVAFLPQNPMALLHRASVAAEIAWTVRRDASAHDASDLMADLGLAHLAQRDPRDLSSGERQRAAIAAVLAGSPSIALLDEPTRGMDDGARDALCRVVLRMRADGCSIVLATHDINLARTVADRIVRVGAGVASECIAAGVA